MSSNAPGGSVEERMEEEDVRGAGAWASPKGNSGVETGMDVGLQPWRSPPSDLDDEGIELRDNVANHRHARTCPFRDDFVLELYKF